MGVGWASYLITLLYLRGSWEELLDTCDSDTLKAKLEHSPHCPTGLSMLKRFANIYHPLRMRLYDSCVNGNTCPNPGTHVLLEP